jgi:dynein heavy chain
VLPRLFTHTNPGYTRGPTSLTLSFSSRQETKRIAFPRFYFVAAADLLDFLSKGTNPQLILRHLSKCFDNVHNLSFAPDEKGNHSKTAISMWSGEKENVAFAGGGCICDGPVRIGGFTKSGLPVCPYNTDTFFFQSQVETWLGSVVDTMRAALFAEFKTSLPRYDEVPRVKWMFEQSAQNTITVSRMIFTQEINDAFDQLEEGNDGAIKDMWQKQIDQLAAIISVLVEPLEKLDRKKVRPWSFPKSATHRGGPITGDCLRNTHHEILTLFISTPRS